MHLLQIFAALWLVLQAGMMITRVQNMAAVSPDINESLVLSPDGALAAWLTASRICVYRFAYEPPVAWDQLDCRSLPVDVAPDIASLSWNAGSNLLAFSGSGDIWLYDTNRARFTNLTRDEELADSAPAWYANDVAFLRTVDADTWIYSVYSGGGFEPTPVVNLSELVPRLSQVTQPTVVSPAGTRFAIVALEEEALGNGVYIVSTTADRIASLEALRASVGDDVDPLAIAWAGDNALVVAVGTGSTVENFVYVDLRTRKLTPLVDVESPQVGMVAPDTFVLAYQEKDAARLSVASIALPPDGSAFEPVGTIGGCLPDRIAGAPRPLNTLTSINGGLIFNCVVEF